jgi:hypothetical protein
MTVMVYKPFLLSLLPGSIDPSAAEHETITVITAMTAAAAAATAAALRYFVLRIKSFLCLFTGLFDLNLAYATFGVYFKSAMNNEQ